MDQRPLVEGFIVNFGIFLEVFELLHFWMIFSVFQKNLILEYSWNVLELCTQNFKRSGKKTRPKYFCGFCMINFFPDHFGAFFGGMRVGQNVRLGYPRRASHSKCTKMIRKKIYITKPTKIFWTCFSAECFKFRGPSSRTFHVWLLQIKSVLKVGTLRENFYNTKTTKIFWTCFFSERFEFRVPSSRSFHIRLDQVKLVLKVGRLQEKKFITQNPQKYFGFFFS